ncbi:NACHT domain-containing protein [Tessaracoccus caeni]|uniref:NACHT domain-containing protein n=1 Tax=Tessaracoccus caeni TaxID=3031239 RepID=UPI0023DA606A|nr:NACHT domain-containing protein [Tessaracoccus caeni]
MKPAVVGQLAEGLAAVAIAAFCGNPIVATALGKAIPMVRSRWEGNAESKVLQRGLTDAITTWAEREHLGDDAGPGLALATGTIAKYGLGPDEMQRCNYDADEITEEIVGRAAKRDPEWVSPEQTRDSAYIVAERSIRTTMAALISRTNQVEAAILPALKQASEGLSDELLRLSVDVGEVKADTGRLVDTLVESASAGDLMIYLQQRIDDWDAAAWIGKRPSQIERKLTMSSENGRSRVSVSDALRDNPHLVILGGPGAGKSWLAKRIAREAAEAALAALRAGTPTSEVELPLFTTWDVWTRQPTGDVRESLIAASFSPRVRHGDLGSTQRVERIRRLLGETPKAVVIVDSIDEATDKGDLEGRIHTLESLHGWHTVVTSRRSIWNESAATRERKKGVVNLEPLTWDDVPPFVSTWFADDPPRGEALIQHLDSDWRLRELATVPLLLSFYCRLAGDNPVDAPLPLRKHDLYDTVIRRLIAGKWRTDEATRKVAEAYAVLTRWAWDAVKDVNHFTGSRRWGETFEPGEAAPDDLRHAVDSVAPEVASDDEGNRFHAFRHRTILEHLVAAHIAGLKPKKALKELLPHLWFDPDWEEVVPRAIAMHKQRDELLSLLVKEVKAEPNSPIASVANEVLDVLLLRVVMEAGPKDWKEHGHAIFDDLKTRMPMYYFVAVTQASPSSTTKAAAIRAVASELESASDSDFCELVELLIELGVVDQNRAERRNSIEAVLQRLQSASDDDVPNLVNLLIALRPDSDASQRASDAVLRVMAAVPSVQLANLLIELKPDDKTRRRGIDAVLRVIPIASGFQLAALVRVMETLGEGSEEAPESPIEVLLRRLARENSWFLSLVVDAMVTLELTEGERQSSVRVLLTRLGNASADDLTHLVKALARFELVPNERREAARLLRERLKRSSSLELRKVVDALVVLGMDPEEREQAIDAVLEFMASERAALLIYRAKALVVFDLDSAERRRGMDVLLQRLEGEGLFDVGFVADALVAFGLDPDERRDAVEVLLLRLKDTSKLISEYLRSALIKVGPGVEARREWVVDAIVVELSRARDHYQVTRLLTALAATVASPTGRRARRAAVAAVLKHLPEAAAYGVASMAKALAELCLTVDERRTVLDEILKQLEGASALDAHFLITAVGALSPDVEDCRTVIAAVLKLLAEISVSVSDEASDTSARGAHDLVVACAALNFGVTARGELVDTVVKMLADASAEQGEWLLKALAAIDLDDEEHRKAACAVAEKFEKLMKAEPSEVMGLVAWVEALSLDDEANDVVKTIRDRLSVAEPGDTVLSAQVQVLTSLVKLDLGEATRQDVVNALARAQIADPWKSQQMVWLIRRWSTTEQWLELLRSEATPEAI